MQVWKWDKKEPILRFSMRDKLKVFKIGVHESARHGLCAGGSARGGLMVWSISTGQLLADVESAHYMEINDLAISSTNSDMIITGGKDCKVRVWMVSTLILEDM
jgi:WD40 repeat protein|tara:strand:- start:915 stop:1226 length:312 start_codon:yes stop_codon:yes gene_type:complete